MASPGGPAGAAYHAVAPAAAPVRPADRRGGADAYQSRVQEYAPGLKREAR